MAIQDLKSRRYPRFQVEGSIWDVRVKVRQPNITARNSKALLGPKPKP